MLQVGITVCRINLDDLYTWMPCAHASPLHFTALNLTTQRLKSANDFLSCLVLCHLSPATNLASSPKISASPLNFNSTCPLSLPHFSPHHCTPLISLLPDLGLTCVQEVQAVLDNVASSIIASPIPIHLATQIAHQPH